VLIEHDWKFMTPQFARSFRKSARQNLFGNRGIPFQSRSTPRLNEHANTKIRTPAVKRSYRGRFEHNITQRPQPHDKDFCAPRQTGEQ